MKDKNISQYRLAKDSGIPYTTIHDICSERAQLEKCSAETVYRISKVLGVSMESLIAPALEERTDFEIFKSNVCHILNNRICQLGL
jgi:plasmid maintenance system antidote protein VapI